MTRTRTPDKTEMPRGTLDMLILHTLRWGTQHGYGISQALRNGSNELFQVETGSLYPALQRLEKRGMVVSEWRTSDNKQRARFYRLTPAGRKHLTREQSRWAELVTAVTSLMRPRRQE